MAKFYLDITTFNLGTDVYWQLNPSYQNGWGWENVISCNKSGNEKDTVKFGFLAYVLHSDDTVTQIKFGGSTAVQTIGSIVWASDDQYAELTGTATPDATNIVATDRLRIDFYATRAALGGWTLIGGINGYFATTAALGWTTIDATQWTVHGYFERKWNDPSPGQLAMKLIWGNLGSYEISYIDGITGTVAPPSAGGILAQVI